MKIIFATLPLLLLAHNKLSEELPSELTIIDMFVNPTVRTLAERLSKLKPEATALKTRYEDKKQLIHERRARLKKRSQ